MSTKLKSLEIEKLHNYYDYNIQFYSLVTFLTGLNGCGKTTILNILEFITRGQLYELFKYNFKRIVLTYSQNKDSEDSKIIISYEGDGLSIIFKGDYYHLPQNIEASDNVGEESRKTDQGFIYHIKYSFLSEISEEFGYSTPLKDIEELFKHHRKIDFKELMIDTHYHTNDELEKYLSIINEFFGKAMDSKVFAFNDRRDLICKYQEDNECINLKDLSLGEQKIVALFYYLVINKDSKKPKFLIFDEPEVSLHLGAQKLFVDSINKIDKDVQLIFATHAPEIIGWKRKNMYEVKGKPLDQFQPFEAVSF